METLFERMAKSLVTFLEVNNEDTLYDILQGEGYTSEEIERFLEIANK